MIPYGKLTKKQIKAAKFSHVEDRVLLCLVHKVGYGSWAELKEKLPECPHVMFDWWLISRTAQRCASLNILLSHCLVIRAPVNFAFNASATALLCCTTNEGE